MANVGAHNAVDAQRHVGEPYRMGVNGAHNTIGEISAPTTLFGLCCASKVVEYCFCMCTGYSPCKVEMTARGRVNSH